MACLRDIAHYEADTIREGVGWVIVYRTGRSWQSISIWLDDNDLIPDEDMTKVKEIAKKDIGAVMLNGYYCGHFAQDMTNEEIATGIRWHYRNGYNLLTDRIEEADAAHRAIETARETAHALGLPFSSYMGTDVDPYVYDGSMSPEDYELMNTISLNQYFRKGGESIKEGVIKEQFIKSLEEILKLTRVGLERLELEDDLVIIHYENGYTKKADITADSGIAIIKDVVNRLV